MGGLTGAGSATGAGADLATGGLAMATGIAVADELLRFFFFFAFEETLTSSGSVVSGITAAGLVSSISLGRTGGAGAGVLFLFAGTTGTV